MNPRTLLNELFRAALAASMPSLAMKVFAERVPKCDGRTIVVGAGKASAAMARSLEQLRPDLRFEGVVVTRYGHVVPCESIEVLEAAHPVPDSRCIEASERILDRMSGLTGDDVVIALISGGGSSLLTLPAKGITLDEKRAINQAMLRAGLPIDEMNCVRKHLSAIKGGRLALAAHPATVLTCLISDVPGDDPATIASGPTVADPTTRLQALEILGRHSITVSQSVRNHLLSPESETPKEILSNVHLAASGMTALRAAANVAKANGYDVRLLGDGIGGEARRLGIEHAELARSTGNGTVILSGGETTVRVIGDGVGGRNVEYLLSLAISLERDARVWALAADTDGIDGIGDAAGALIDPSTLARAEKRSLDPQSFLDHNDAHSFFRAINDAVITGPTYTNVNDFRALIIQ